MIKLFAVTILNAFILCQLFSIENSVLQDTSAIPDSLKLSIEQRIQEEFGITDNSTLTETAHIMNVELSQLKQHLGLDVKNTKLDKMKLRQLGVSVYQVLMAQETIHYGFNETTTLLQIATMYNIPIKKLKTLLHLDPNDSALNIRSIQSLEIDLDSIVEVQKEYKQTLYFTGSNIIIVGMLVVFLSLFITSVIIMQLRHLNMLNAEKTPAADIIVSNKGKMLSAKPDITNSDIVAVITALHIYINQIEERRRLALTFRRNRANFWRASGLYDMPNRKFKNQHN